MLETKLGSLQRIVNATREAAELGWTALMEEDRLLTRIESLENQLIISNKVTTSLRSALKLRRYNSASCLELSRRQAPRRNKKTLRRKEHLSGRFERVIAKSPHGENGNFEEASRD